MEEMSIILEEVYPWIVSWNPHFEICCHVKSKFNKIG
jgi:hypothetical protein